MFQQVCVNGLQHCTFKHRIPLENVSTLGICGDVIINYFGFVEVSNFFLEVVLMRHWEMNSWATCLKNMTIEIIWSVCQNWSESSMAVEMNDIQDMSITSGSLIDVPSEISHPLSSPVS